MTIKVFEVEQGSPAWHQARAGVCTASMFAVARAKTGGLDERQQKYVDLVRAGHDKATCIQMAGYKAAPTSETIQRAIAGEKVAEPSAGAMVYAFRLAIERISGEALQDDQFETYAMRRGHELEPAARDAHEALGVMVLRAGFVTTEDGRLGASTDGWISHDGCAEYKCLVSPEGLRRILLDDDLSEFQDQLQGGLLVTGRQWMHFGLYCPALEPIGQALTLRVVRRDEAYIAKLAADLREFTELVDQYEAKLRAGGDRNALAIVDALACIS